MINDVVNIIIKPVPAQKRSPKDAKEVMIKRAKR
jgi:hypothetical protein